VTFRDFRPDGIRLCATRAGEPLPDTRPLELMVEISQFAGG